MTYRPSTFLLLLLLFALSASAQRVLTLRSFEPATNDISARQYERLDRAGQPCGLIKVYLPIPGCKFTSGPRVIGDTEYKDNTYWVYVVRGTKRLQIICPNMEPSDIDWGTGPGMNNAVQSHATYILKLDGYEILLTGPTYEPTSSMSESTSAPTSEVSNYNSHAYVDLGLSVKWATCNVGANSPEEYGNYYAWGETTTKSEYEKDNCKTYGWKMSDIGGNVDYDVACASWGESWRMPTLKEMKELVSKCTWLWTTQGGKKGYKVTSKKNGNFIFLPAAGGHYEYPSLRSGENEYGTYWTSKSIETENAHTLSFGSSYYSVEGDERFRGHTIRPVSE